MQRLLIGLALLAAFTVSSVGATKPLPPVGAPLGGPLSTSDPSLNTTIPCATTQPLQTWNYLASPGEGTVDVAVRVQGTGTLWLTVAGGAGVGAPVNTGAVQQIVHLRAALPLLALGDQFAVGGSADGCPAGGLIVTLITAHIAP